jgi:hypothetical protein
LHAPFLPIVPFCVPTWACMRAHPPYSLKVFFPHFSIFHLEFRNLVVVDEFVVTLVAATIILSIALAFSSSFFLVGVIFFSCCWLRDVFLWKLEGRAMLKHSKLLSSHGALDIT